VPKSFRIAAESIEPLATGLGACFATDRITVDGLQVSYAYREAPDFAQDSGWRFFSGDEDQAYVDEPANTEIYDVNTIANYDPEIVPILNTPAPAAFERARPGDPITRVAH
jgi:hypothetical protein